MSRTNLYWTDDRDRLNCAHGVILHGTRCVQCERGDLPEPRSFIADAVRAGMAGKFRDGGFIPKSLRATGFDTASGPDRTATGTYQRVGDTMRFTVDDIETDYSWRDEVERRTKAAHEKINEALRRSAGGRDYYTVPPFVWPHSKGDPRPRDGHWGPRSRAPEIITDPLDQRGVNARRVGPGR